MFDMSEPFLSLSSHKDKPFYNTNQVFAYMLFNMLKIFLNRIFQIGFLVDAQT